MKQSDIKIASELAKKIDEFETYLAHLKNENVDTSAVDFRIQLAIHGNNYNIVTKNISTGIKDTIRNLLIVDLESQVQFMKKRIEQL